MTNIKAELKAALLELLQETIAPAKSSASTGFGSLAEAMGSRKVYVQANDDNPDSCWYTLDANNKINECIMHEQFTGRVVEVNTIDRTGDRGETCKIEVTMKPDGGQPTVFNFGLSNRDGYVTSGKTVLAILSAIEPTDLLTIAPVEGKDSKGQPNKAVLVNSYKNGQPLRVPQKDLDWAALTLDAFARFGGQHKPLPTYDDGYTSTAKQPTRTAAPKTSKPPSATPAGFDQHKPAWAKLFKYGGDTPEHLKYNTEAITAWVLDRYAVKNVSSIPLSDQLDALAACEALLHEAYFPAEVAEVVEAPVEKVVHTIEVDFDDIPF